MALHPTDSEARIRNASPGLRFFLTGILSIGLMYADHQGTWLEQVRSRLGAAMYPLQVAVSAPASGLRWTRESLALRRTLLDQNAQLRDEALAASAKLQRMASLEAENTRLRALLDARSRVRDRVIVGEILAVDMDPHRHRVVLNKGGQDGIGQGLALIDARGAVGQITRDQRVTSEAILITDPDHAVPVEIVRNGLRTIAVGTGDLERLSLPFLTRNADIRRGDLLVTSGLGGAFPAGYPVATVSSLDDSSGGAFREVGATPLAQLDRLHEVLIVLPAPGTPEPQAAQAEPAAKPASAPGQPAAEPAAAVAQPAAEPPPAAAAPAPESQPASQAASQAVQPAPAPAAPGQTPEPPTAQENSR